MTDPRTGRSRYRVNMIHGGLHLLVLQVEVRSPNTPITRWRDATVEDLSEQNEIPKLKVTT